MQCWKKGPWLIAASIVLLVTGALWAAVTTIPSSALISSNQLYTDTIGGGIGAIVTSGNLQSDGRNDDGSSAANPLGFTLNFFGNNYTQYFINNNGNITFQSALHVFTPQGPQGATQPVISPFFADVDTQNPASGVVHLRTDIPNQIIVTWSQVGYFSSNADKLDNFQLVLRGPAYSVPPGEGRIGFFYTNMQWEVGDASGGTGGFCVPPNTVGDTCFPAAIGFGDGNSNGITIQGSLQNGIAASLQNKRIWFDLNGGVPVVSGTTTVPTLGTYGMMMLGILLFGAALWYTRREAQSA
ncbi:MAG TPA: nidogen-like domain-containing protein [Candidatus Sulfopaludibacter sp.]|jgi:hypothetical protein|nr:nidogen-like domain-containing protein [Candidatus Sulfopaludibacter sp.]